MAITVLLIDDESPFVEALAKRLLNRGFAIVKSTSGPEALKKLQENPAIDVAVCDVKMPVMDGIETLRLIKSEYPMVEVILLTGHATVQSAIQGMRLGALDYLMKPCDMDLLITKIHEAKDKKSAQENKIAQAIVDLEGPPK
ncbi:MAG: response regulator [Desulfomonilaceae bacterium]